MEPSDYSGTYQPECAKCGKMASTVVLTREDAAKYRLVYEGLGGGTGDHGHLITEDEARKTARAFSKPYSAAAMEAADFHDNGGMCVECKLFYCEDHWYGSPGPARCPEDHSRIQLDPFWQPPELEYQYLRDMSPNPEFWERFGDPEDWR